MSLIDREAVLALPRNRIRNMRGEIVEETINVAYIEQLPSAQPEPHEIGYSECASSTLKMWIDNVLTDGEYSHIMDKLNAYWAERKTDEQVEVQKRQADSNGF